MEHPLGVSQWQTLGASEESSCGPGHGGWGGGLGTLYLQRPPAESVLHPAEGLLLSSSRRTPDWNVPEPLPPQRQLSNRSEDEHRPLCPGQGATGSPSSPLLKVAFISRPTLLLPPLPPSPRWMAMSQPIRLSVVSSWPVVLMSGPHLHTCPFTSNCFWLGFVLYFHSWLPPLPAWIFSQPLRRPPLSLRYKHTVEFAPTGCFFLHVWDFWSHNPILPVHMIDLKPSPRWASESHNKTWIWRDELGNRRSITPKNNDSWELTAAQALHCRLFLII